MPDDEISPGLAALEDAITIESAIADVERPLEWPPLTDEQRQLRDELGVELGWDEP